MPDVDTDRLIVIVTGIQLRAELGDRPLAYRLEREVRDFLDRHLPKRPPGQPPQLAPVVVSDVFYLNNDAVQTRPTIAIGGPGMNALTATLVEELPTALALDETLVIQMHLDPGSGGDDDGDDDGDDEGVGVVGVVGVDGVVPPPRSPSRSRCSFIPALPRSPPRTSAGD